MGWTQISGPVGNVYVGGYGVFAEHATTKNIEQYDELGKSWNTIGGPGFRYAVNDVTIYGISPNKDGLWKYTAGAALPWSLLGSGPMEDVIAGGQDVYFIERGTGAIWDATTGVRVGDPGAQFVCNSVDLYRLAPDRDQVHPYNGGAWGPSIPGHAFRLYAFGPDLYATMGDAGDIHWFDGGWVRLGGPGRDFARTESSLYRLAPDMSDIDRFDMALAGPWTSVGVPTDRMIGIWARGGGDPTVYAGRGDPDRSGHYDELWHFEP